MKLRQILWAMTGLAMPVIAHAQPVTGPYVSFGGGVSILNPPDFDFEQTGATGKLQFKPGYAVIGGIGYGFGDGFRVELDGSEMHNTVHKADYSGGTQTRMFGAERKYGGMVNVFYDASVHLPISPFIGAGVGYQYANYYPYLGNGEKRVICGTAGSFAYDVIAGAAYPVAQVPGLSVTAEYQFMQLVQSRVYDYANYGRKKVGQESSSAVLLGLRYQIFNPPPEAPAPAPLAAPAAAPAPAPAKTYLVFFDWDKYNLTPRARSIIATAAADSKTAAVTTIDVSGYTDTSGGLAYNMGLSWKRAKAVAAQLVADGVPAAEIQTRGFGETHLLVPTGPNVREPQNRRVEIVLR